MKIITKDNFCRDYYTETVVAENVNEFMGKQLVDKWNKSYWTEQSDYYLELVDDNYEIFDGYANFP